MDKNLNQSFSLYLSLTLLSVALLSASPGRKTISDQFSLAINSADTSGIVYVRNAKGPTLGYSSKSGVKILKVGENFFKDLNKNSQLDKYEDWRLPVEDRAKDLATKLSIDQIAGLMLYSGHQAVPANPSGFGAATYNGQPFAPKSAKAADVTDQQKMFLI